jgi:phytoene synthase
MVGPELSYCAQQLRRLDPDRYLTALFAPDRRREGLFALYAFNLEVARAREAVREPMMGLIRLQWWRDALEEIYAGRPRAHEVVSALAAAIDEHRLEHRLFQRLIEAREQDMQPDPPADLPALQRYAEETSSTLVELALSVLGQPAAEVREAGRAVGIAWALVGLLRALPFHAAQRRVYLPAAMMADAGLTPTMLFDRRSSPALAEVARAVAAKAREALAAGRRHPGQVPRRFQPALLPATLADGYLRRLAASGYDPFDARVQLAPPGRIWTLALRRVVGGY